jgi:hypothetical protein
MAELRDGHAGRVEQQVAGARRRTTDYNHFRIEQGCQL